MNDQRHQRASKRIILGIVACHVGMIGPGAAQETIIRRTAALEEVIVTAERREESLQETPLAVSAYSHETLRQLNVYSPTDIARFTPNMLAAAQPGASATANYSIRGITQTEPSLSVDPGVGVYMNGVYIARNNTLATDFIELERVEVLRGPQGTLYGRNSAGGAVNIITAKPSGDLRLSQRFSMGNYAQFRSITTFDTPEWNGLSARLAYMRNKSHGYVKNRTRDFQQGKAQDFGAIDQDAAYIALHWAHGSWTLDYQFDWSNSHNVPPAFQLTHVDISQARAFVDSVFGSGFFDSANGAPIRLTYQQAAIIAEPSHRVRSMHAPYAGREDDKTYGHALTATWDFSPELTLKSITGYRKMELVHRTDFSGGASMPTGTGQWIALFAGGGNEPMKRNEQFSQELQLLGHYNRADMVMGLYYFNENGFSSGSSQVSVNLGNWGPEERAKIDNSAWAAYGQTTFHLTEKMDLTGGLRYTRDQRELKTTAFMHSINQFQTSAFRKNFHNVSGTVSANYAWTDDLSSYFRIATGYKSGGFLDRTDPSVQRPFKAEKLISYELGLKSEWFDRHLRFNGALFYSLYDDLQVAQFVPSASGDQSIISNAGKASYKGVELELTAIPLPGLILNLSYGYLDPKYDKYEFFDPTGQFCGTARVACDVADHAHFPTAPEHTAALGAQYSMDAFELGTLTARIDLTYNSGYQHGSIDTPSDRWVEADAHTLLSGRLALTDIRVFRNSSLELALWGRNLTDREYIAYGIGSFDVMGFSGGVFNPPRTYGIDLEMRF